MKFFIVYDGAGEIVGRYSVTDPKQMENYPAAVETDSADYHSTPEHWAEVDVTKKTIHPKPDNSDPTGKARKPKSRDETQ